jgi:hypothetical protein
MSKGNANTSISAPWGIAVHGLMAQYAGAYRTGAHHGAAHVCDGSEPLFGSTEFLFAGRKLLCDTEKHVCGGSKDFKQERELFTRNPKSE